MSNTYSWKINALKCVQNPQPNYVAIAEWTATGTDGQHTAVIHGSTAFSSDSRNGVDQPFTQYSELTESTVLGWVKDNAAVSDIEATLDNQLSNLGNPPVGPQTAGLPWANN
jgi:hypothetical protein